MLLESHDSALGEDLVLKGWRTCQKQPAQAESRACHPKAQVTLWDSAEDVVRTLLPLSLSLPLSRRKLQVLKQFCLFPRVQGRVSVLCVPSHFCILNRNTLFIADFSEFPHTVQLNVIKATCKSENHPEYVSEKKNLYYICSHV